MKYVIYSEHVFSFVNLDIIYNKSVPYVIEKVIYNMFEHDSVALVLNLLN